MLEVQKKCSKCGEIKELSDFYKDKYNKDGLTNHCRTCNKKQKQNYIKNNPWAACLGNARFRCNNPKSKDYKDYGLRGIKCLLIMDEIKTLWFYYKAYEMKQPSINRKDNNGNYTFDNCEFIEWGKNSAERNVRVCSKTILQLDKNSIFIKEWPSATVVEKVLGFNQGNIQRVVGKSKLAYGYIWRYKC